MATCIMCDGIGRIKSVGHVAQCPGCNGTGDNVLPGQVEVCLACEGTGWLDLSVITCGSSTEGMNREARDEQHRRTRRPCMRCGGSGASFAAIGKQGEEAGKRIATDLMKEVAALPAGTPIKAIVVCEDQYAETVTLPSMAALEHFRDGFSCGISHYGAGSAGVYTLADLETDDPKIVALIRRHLNTEEST